MSVAKKNRPIAGHNSPLLGHDARLLALLAQVHGETGQAVEFLREYGLTTNFAQQASKLLQNPLEFHSDNIENSHNQLRGFIQSVVAGFLKNIQAEAGILAAWVAKAQDSRMPGLAFTIVLKDYSLEKRALLRNFRLSYVEVGLSGLVPLEFNIIPAELAGEIEKESSSQLSLEE